MATPPQSMKAMILDLRKVPLDRLADPLTQMQEPGYAGLATSAALSSGPVTSSPGPGWPIDLMVAFATAASHQTTQELPDPDQGSPLRLLAQRGVWRLFGGTAWSFGLPIRITNITEEPITLAHYRQLNGSNRVRRPPFSPDIQPAVDASIAALSAEHDSELFIDEIIAPPGEPITR